MDYNAIHWIQNRSRFKSFWKPKKLGESTKVAFIMSGCLKFHFWNSVISLYENKALQLMSAGASLEKFGAKVPYFHKVKIVQTLF